MKSNMSDLPKTSAPAQRALQGAGITTLKQLTKITEADVLALHGMGPKAFGILRDALKAKGWSFKHGGAGDTVRKKGSPVNRTDQVKEYLRGLSHPLKAEVAAVRSIIKSVNKNINEEVKWNAPSFNYKGEYLVTFNLRNPKLVHLVFHNPLIPQVKSALLEGDYMDRRMMYFINMNDIKTKQTELVRVLKKLIKLQEKLNG